MTVTKGEPSGHSGNAEKQDATSAASVSVADGVDGVDFSQVNERRLMRKIDFRIVPWLSLLYLLNSLDRSNIGNSRVSSLYYPAFDISFIQAHILCQLYGMEQDLHITNTQYLLALTSFFFPYALFELPSNVLLKRLRPSRWLSFLILCWGVVMTMHGVVKNYGHLVGE